MAVEKVSGGTVKNTVGFADKVRNVLQSVENLFNLAMVNRVFEDESIPCSKLQTGCISSLDYQYYAAIITQTSTSAPVVNYLIHNDFGTPVWARSNVGIYSLTFPSPVLTDTRSIVFTSMQPLGANVKIGAEISSTTVVDFRTWNALSATDAAIYRMLIEVRVYS